MRRGSLVGPVILILIGGVFLLNNIRPDLSVIEMLISYWPFLLIGWGFLRLAEILFAASRSSVVPERGVGGGEWGLIILLCLLGSGAFFARQRISHWGPGSFRIRGVEMFGEAFDYNLEEKRVACSKTPRILIENFRGNARVVGSDISEVKVTGRKTVRAFSQSEADGANQDSRLEVVNQGDLVVIRTNLDRARSDRRVSADLEISVPKGATVEGRGRYGDFDVSEIAGNVDINSDNAGVRVQNIGGNVRTDLRRSDIVRAVGVKGSVEIKNRGDNVELENIEGQVTISGAYGGELQFRNIAKAVRFEGEQTQWRVEQVPGQVRMARGYWNGNGVVGPVQIRGRSKDVQISDFTQSLELNVDRGDLEIRPGKLPMGKMDVRTHNGDIEIAIPPAAKFDLRADVDKGEINNEFGGGLRNESSGRGSQLRGTVGEGGPALVLHADHGTMTVRKATGEYASPAPPRGAGPAVVEAPPVPPAPPATPIPVEKN